MRKYKKICILTSVHSAFDIRIFHKEAKSLSKAGYDVTLVAPYKKDIIIEGVKIVSIPKVRMRYRLLGVNRKLYKKALNQKADVYHFHDPELIPWVVKLKKKTRARVIYDVHEDYPKQILSKYWIPKILRKIISIFINFYEKRMVKNFDYVITVGEEIEERFRKNNSNVETIKNFPDVEKFRNIKKEKNNESIFNLIYIGGISKVRGINQLVQAMEYLPKEVKLTLFGKFSPEEYKEEVKKIKGFEKTEYLGWISFDKMPYQLFKSDIGVICFLPEPNHINSCPNKLFEYMVAELPVIASNFPSWKEIVEGNNCGICVNPLEPEEIAKAVKYLIRHPKEAKKMGENGRKAVLEKYNWENESKKLLNIYSSL